MQVPWGGGIIDSIQSNALILCHKIMGIFAIIIKTAFLFSILNNESLKTLHPVSFLYLCSCLMSIYVFPKLPRLPLHLIKLIEYQVLMSMLVCIYISRRWQRVGCSFKTPVNLSYIQLRGNRWGGCYIFLLVSHICLWLYGGFFFFFWLLLFSFLLLCVCVCYYCSFTNEFVDLCIYLKVMGLR
jgi:hypothetical protein